MLAFGRCVLVKITLPRKTNHFPGKPIYTCDCSVVFHCFDVATTIAICHCAMRFSLLSTIERRDVCANLLRDNVEHARIIRSLGTRAWRAIKICIRILKLSINSQKQRAPKKNLSHPYKRSPSNAYFFQAIVKQVWNAFALNGWQSPRNFNHPHVQFISVSPVPLSSAPSSSLSSSSSSSPPSSWFVSALIEETKEFSRD